MHYAGDLCDVKFQMKWKHYISFMPAPVYYHCTDDTYTQANSDSVKM